MNDAAIATLKKNGTYLVPTLYLVDWQRENAAKANLPDFAQTQDGNGFGRGKGQRQKGI